MKKICFFLVIVFLFSLCGCQYAKDFIADKIGESFSENRVMSTEEKDASQMLENTLLVLSGEEEIGGAVLGFDGMPAEPANSGMAKLLSGYVEFQIQSMEVDGDTAVAVVDITAPDSMALVQELVDMTDDLSSAAELEENLKSLLKDDPKLVTNTVEVQMCLVDDIWCVVPDMALSNAFTGGMTQWYLELQQSVYEGLLEGGEQG